MSGRRVFAVSVDLDPIPCYYRIHGLGPAPGELRDLVFRRCLPRFAELFARQGIRATFFVVAEDVDVDVLGDSARAARALLGDLAAEGHEIASHSYSHPYDMARLPREEVARELGRAHELLGEITGAPVRGFRAPGYDLSPEMLAELMRLGYQYDSSIFPAPGYYAAKAAVMAAMKVARRRSGAVLTDPRALAAPAEPYRPAPEAPWRRGQATLVEIPIAVTPWARIPAIGTSLLLAPEGLRRRWVAAMRRRHLFNFELHGIDLADAEEDGVPGALVSRQPDLRAPLARKEQALTSVLSQARNAFEPARLTDVAAWVHRELA